MKKLFTLLLVLVCCVGTASAGNVTKRFYVVNEITGWTGWGSDLKIHVFYNNGTGNVNLTEWNKVSMTKVCDISGETNKALYYKDLEIDENIVNNYDLTVMVLANDVATNDNDYHKCTGPAKRYTSDYVYYVYNNSTVGCNAAEVIYYLASWPTGDNPTRTFTTLTGSNGVYSADIAIPTEATYYCLAPSFALSYTGSTPTNIKWWDALYRRNSEGDYWINNFQFYTDGMTLTKRSSGKTYDNGIWYYPENGLTTKSKFDFDIINMTFTVKPYFTRTTSNNPNSTGYMTYSSAYKTAIPDGISAYYASDLSNGEVVLTPVSNGLWNNTAYMLKGEKNTEYTFYATDATPSKVPSGNLLKASVTATDITTEMLTNKYYYFFSSNPEEAFYRLDAPATSAAGKAYLETTQTIGSTATGEAKLSIIIDDSETTSIKDAKAVSYDENAPMYNLAGQRVAKDFKGVVIQGGKKFIVK